MSHGGGRTRHDALRAVAGYPVSAELAMLLFLKNLLFTVFVPGTVAVLIPYRIVERANSGRAFELPWLLWSAPLFLLGAGIYFWCLWDFAVTGRGTPAPIDPPKRLVVRGLYRYVRNPMYLGVWLVLAGWTAFSRSGQLLLYGLAVAVLSHLFVVFVEEPLLGHRFGASYEAYRRAVRRWLPGRAYRPGTEPTGG
jgi:protein-S-isoprenylcysteine O-methyltransferase Ste14